MKKILLGLMVFGSVAACDRIDDTVVVRQCGDYAVEMTFSETGETMNAVINGDALTLTNETAASGARYVGNLNDTSVTLWGKGKDWIMILDDDMVIECSVK